MTYDMGLCSDAIQHTSQNFYIIYDGRLFLMAATTITRAITPRLTPANATYIMSVGVYVEVEVGVVVEVEEEVVDVVSVNMSLNTKPSRSPGFSGCNAFIVGKLAEYVEPAHIISPWEVINIS